MWEGGSVCESVGGCGRSVWCVWKSYEEGVEAVWGVWRGVGVWERCGVCTGHMGVSFHNAGIQVRASRNAGLNYCEFYVRLG